jgi:hypothetical protein
MTSDPPPLDKEVKEVDMEQLEDSNNATPIAPVDTNTIGDTAQPAPPSFLSNPVPRNQLQSLRKTLVRIKHQQWNCPLLHRLSLKIHIIVQVLYGKRRPHVQSHHKGEAHAS